MTGQQFFWTSRYPGADGKLGPRDYSLICAENPTGYCNPQYVEHRINTLKGNAELGVEGDRSLLLKTASLSYPVYCSFGRQDHKRPNRYMKDQLQEELDALEDEMDEIDDHILRRNQTLDRITKSTPKTTIWPMQKH